MRWPRLSNHRFRQGAVALAGLVLMGLLILSGSIVMLGSKPAKASGKPVQPDSIALTGRLHRFDYNLEDTRTVLINTTISGKAYLVKDDQTALAGADIRFEVARLGLAGQMTPTEPGQYTYTITEPVRIHSPVPFLQTLNWQVRNLRIEVDGRDESTRIIVTDKKAQSKNFTRKDHTGAGLAVFSSPQTYTLSTNTKISFRVEKSDGTPAANMTAVIELPNRDYREELTTDADGWVRIDRTDEMQLAIQGGDLVTIQGPIFIELPEDEETLFWWEDPTERCEMVLRASQKRLAIEPGQTALFGFEVVNRGNQPDVYRFTVAGLPEDWVELEYDSVELMPFFGQVIYVSVTPTRHWETKAGGHRLTMTVDSSCDEMSASSELKVTNFHQSAVDIHGSSQEPSEKIASDLRQIAKAVGKDAALEVIIRSGGALPMDAEADIERLGGTVSQQFSLIPGMVVKIPAAKLDEVGRLGWVRTIDPNREVKTMLDRSVPITGAKELWDLGYDGTGVKVAVIDTGVDYTHPAIAGRVILGPDFINNDDDPMDGHGHGTHVASTIASGDPIFRGVAPGATIMAVKALSDDGGGTEASVIAGIEWAMLNGADVINLSIGGAPGGGWDPMAQAVDIAVKSGVLVVVAAGNDGPDHDTISSPGDARLALTVGASDNRRNLADWSSRGPTLDGRAKPDVIAPGTGITAAIPGNSWAAADGTSMATPHVAGVGALLVQATGAEPLLIKEALKRTALDLKYGLNSSGAGFIQPLQALADLRHAMTLLQQEVYPGQTALYDFTLQNQGNVDDRFRLTHWIANNGLRFEAQPSLPHGAVRSRGDARIASGTTMIARAEVSIPEDWAGMEDTLYVFHLRSTSLADYRAIDEDRAAVKVKATKRSMSEYTRLKVQDLHDEIAAMRADASTIADLVMRTGQLEDEVARASTALAQLDEGMGNERLSTADSLAADLGQQIDLRQLSGRLTEVQGGHLKGSLSQIQVQIITAMQTPVEPQ